MSSVLDPQPDQPPADELVAYLDGELPPEDCRRVENRLATDDEYRQQLHELDRAWEALDALPASTVDDGFARTTIELACVAAEADLTEYTSFTKTAKRSRTRQWVAAAVAAVVIGFLAGQALIPDRNTALLADLPAIHQFNVLPFVEDVEFLRRLSTAVPPGQLIKDGAVLDRNLKELDHANNASLEARRDWMQSLPPERKAELADRARTFNELEQSAEERDRMRKVMADIRDDRDAATLQRTLIAYGQWLSRFTAGQQEQLREELYDLTVDKQVDVVQRRLERERDFEFRHLTPADAEALRHEIMQIAKDKKSEFPERMRPSRKGERGPNPERPLARQATMIAIGELFRGKEREKTEKRLIGKLSKDAQVHWENLGRSQRESAKPRQLWVWIQDAMKLKANPEELERFFASDKLTPDKRQELLNQPRAEMDAELERMYLRAELGVDNPQWFGGIREPGRGPRSATGIGQPPREGGPNRPPGFVPDREMRPDGPPNDRRPRRPPGTIQTPKDQKQEAI